MQVGQTIALQIAPDRYLELRLTAYTPPADDRKGDFKLVGQGILTDALCDVPMRYGEKYRGEIIVRNQRLASILAPQRK